MSNTTIKKRITELESEVKELNSQISTESQKIAEREIQSKLHIDDSYKKAARELADYQPPSMNLKFSKNEVSDVINSEIEQVLNSLNKI